MTISPIETDGSVGSWKIPTATSGDLSLYFHIPFCTKKCPYCHFYVLPNREDLKKRLLEGLQLEFERIRPHLEGKRIVSTYFGGGTPSLFFDGIKKILTWLPLSDYPEITLEANPEDLDFSLLNRFRKIGINRLSIGVQSLHDPSLITLGRTHSAPKAIEAIIDAHKASFENISIDLMYDLPKQGLQSWKSTLDSLSSLPVTHLSLYNLTLEAPSLFYRDREKIERQQPAHEDSLQMLQYALSSLEGMGLHRYEISAFAQPGLHSRHNTGYWLGRPFLGLGPSAFSYMNQKRYRNVANLNKYLSALKENRAPIDYEEKLEPEAALREHLCIQLRLLQGVDLRTFENQWGSIPKKEIQSSIDQELLIQDGTHLRLTEKGLLFYDTLASELI